MTKNKKQEIYLMDFYNKFFLKLIEKNQLISKSIFCKWCNYVDNKENTFDKGIRFDENIFMFFEEMIFSSMF